MREFVDVHWRDVVGLIVLYTGVALVLFNPEVGLGEQLAFAGVATLKLETKKNGNGLDPGAH